MISCLISASVFDCFFACVHAVPTVTSMATNSAMAILRPFFIYLHTVDINPPDAATLAQMLHLLNGSRSLERPANE